MKVQYNGECIVYTILTPWFTQIIKIIKYAMSLSLFSAKKFGFISGTRVKIQISQVQLKTIKSALQVIALTVIYDTKDFTNL